MRQTLNKFIFPIVYLYFSARVTRLLCPTFPVSPIYKCCFQKPALIVYLGSYQSNAFLNFGVLDSSFHYNEVVSSFDHLLCETRTQRVNRLLPHRAFQCSDPVDWVVSTTSGYLYTI